MRGYYYLNFSNLNEETQEQLIQDAKDDLEETQKEELEADAEAMNIDYEELLQERAKWHMYSFNFVFNV